MRLPQSSRWTWPEVAAAALAWVVLVYFGLRWMADDGGVAHVADDQLAVIDDHLGSRQTLVTQPGYQLFVPWLQEVQRFDKSPNEYRMRGGECGPNLAPQLTVRANDGSSFWFEDFSLHYALLPERAAELLEDSGPGDGFKSRLINAFARSVLREEFGRYSAEEIVVPDNLHAATRRSQERLDELLAPHGLVVMEITTPKPRFDPEYEKAIERRKVADQMIQHLQAKRVQLQEEKLQNEARTRKEKEVEKRVLQNELEQQLLAAERDAIRSRSDAEIFFLEMTSAGRAVLSQKEAQAAELTERYALEARGLAERLDALERQGERVVRAALVEKLRAIEFSFVPYSRDATPERVETDPPSKK
jgi:SPFH domain/Band 7 family protein